MNDQDQMESSFSPESQGHGQEHGQGHGQGPETPPKPSTGAPNLARLAAAKSAYLRIFCNEYYPEIVDLAESEKNPDAINLMVFSSRNELQTPKPSELTVIDFWESMIALEGLVSTT